MTNEYGKHIEIEKMLFGDYRVQVWDEQLDSMLDREYFCRSWESALMTAICVQLDFYPELYIYSREMGTVEVVRLPASK